MEIDVHTLGKLAQILARMKSRLKAFKDLPEGFRRAEIEDVNEIQEIFNSEFVKKEGGREG